MKWPAAILFLGVLGLLSSCAPPPVTEAVPNPDYDYSAVVAAIVGLHRDADANWPEHFEGVNPPRLGTEFDPNAYFTVLTHLSMADDLVLDYVFELHSNGVPWLYARTQSAERFKTYPDYEKALGGREAVFDGEGKAFDHVRADGLPESFFELAVLHELGGQFYLVWHYNYRRTRIVLTRDDVIDIITFHDVEDFGSRFTGDQRRGALSIDLEPRIRFVGPREVTVSIVVFYDWRGFMRVTFHFRRQFPHTLVDVKVEDLVEYDCGMRY